LCSTYVGWELFRVCFDSKAASGDLEAIDGNGAHARHFTGLNKEQLLLESRVISVKEEGIWRSGDGQVVVMELSFWLRRESKRLKKTALA
jgi:hypothetical protein